MGYNQICAYFGHDSKGLIMEGKKCDGGKEEENMVAKLIVLKDYKIN